MEQNMKKRKLGTTDLFVTPVAFGVLTMGGSQMDLPLQEGAELIRYAIDKGINFFDTASITKLILIFAKLSRAWIARRKIRISR